jgi:hypothetical protein
VIKTRTNLAAFMISPQNGDTLTITHFKGDQKLHNDLISAINLLTKETSFRSKINTIPDTSFKK